MNVYLDNKNTSQCSGCGACAFACPKNCIHLMTNEEGFFYPTVDASACINCNKCAVVCPFENAEEHKHSKQQAYAAFTHNEDYLMNSSSGGIFSEIAASFIKDGGVVCGVTIDEKHQVYHTIIDKTEDLVKIQGSKYVQSDLYSCFEKIADVLSGGKKVLFSGTPCQVSAVKKMFKSPSLYTVDVLCHGVPSQKLFDEYIKYLEKKHRGELVEIAFRDKVKNGWSITQRYKIKKNDKVKTYYLDRHLSEYFSGFLRNMTQRESCYNCPYTTVERVGDITLADFWGVDKVRPELYNGQGTSLVFVNSEEGKSLLHSVLPNIEINEVSIQDATFQNVNFISPPERNKARDNVYLDVYKCGFKKAGKATILPKNAYKYRIWAVLQKMHLVRALNQRGK